MSDLITNKNYKFNPYIYEKKQSIFAGIGVAAGAVATKSLGEFRAFEDGMNEVFTLLPGISSEAMDQMSGHSI